MAVQRICKIEGCGKPVRTRGWCGAHYWRWHRHGDPLGGGINQGEALRYLREVVLTDERGANDPCLIWPYAKTGKGYACIGGQDGGSRYVHRRVCEHVHGPAPTPDHEGAHGCGQGEQGCVTKSHLRWATTAENHADKLIHGTHNRGERHGLCSITESQARSILALKDKRLQKDIAADFGVSKVIVSRIHRRETWAWL